MSFRRQRWPLIRYSLSPERKRRRETSTSLNSIGRAPSSLSKVRETSARESASRRLVPLKITSSISVPRSSFAERSPSTQRNASTTFDFPHPFGPTIAVVPGWNWNSTGSAKDLKPARVSFFRYIRPRSFGAAPGPGDGGGARGTIPAASAGVLRERASLLANGHQCRQALGQKAPERRSHQTQLRLSVERAWGDGQEGRFGPGAPRSAWRSRRDLHLRERDLPHPAAADPDLAATLARVSRALPTTPRLSGSSPRRAPTRCGVDAGIMPARPHGGNTRGRTGKAGGRSDSPRSAPWRRSIPRRDPRASAPRAPPPPISPRPGA